MIHQLDLYGRDKVEKAIQRLQTYEPKEGYYLCFSGGKDSCVIKALAEMVDKQMTHLSHGCIGTSTNDFQNFNADEWFEWWIY